MKRTKEYKWWERLIYGKRALEIFKKSDETQKEYEKLIEVMDKESAWWKEFNNSLIQDAVTVGDTKTLNEALIDAVNKANHITTNTNSLNSAKELIKIWSENI